jgi:hypothetical protein
VKETGWKGIDWLPLVCSFYLCLDYGFLECDAVTLKMEAADSSEAMVPNTP